jgi:hypothetical protein
MAQSMAASLFDKGAPGHGPHNNILRHLNTHFCRFVIRLPGRDFTSNHRVFDLFDGIIPAHYFLLRCILLSKSFLKFDNICVQVDGPTANRLKLKINGRRF